MAASPFMFFAVSSNLDNESRQKAYTAFEAYKNVLENQSDHQGYRAFIKYINATVPKIIEKSSDIFSMTNEIASVLNIASKHHQYREFVSSSGPFLAALRELAKKNERAEESFQRLVLG